MSKLLKTNSKAYMKAWEAYIAGCIDVDGDESPSLKDKLEYASDCFVSEYCYPDNLKRYPNVQQRMREYLMGLPFGFAFNHGDIVEAACRLHGVESLTESQSDMVRDNWFDHCALMLLRIADRHGVSMIGANK